MKNIYQKYFGQRLKSIRKHNGMSQLALGEFLGVHCVTISRWENSVVYPDVEKLVEIARLFSVTTDYLLGLDFGCGLCEKRLALEIACSRSKDRSVENE